MSEGRGQLFRERRRRSHGCRLPCAESFFPRRPVRHDLRLQRGRARWHEDDARARRAPTISDYSATAPYGTKMMRALLVNRVRLQGFIIFDRQDLYVKAVTQLA